MTEPEFPVDESTDTEANTKPPTWVVVAVDYDRRNVEWVLWAFTDGVEIYAGKVEANGGQFFEGDYERAASHWRAFASN